MNKKILLTSLAVVLLTGAGCSTQPQKATTYTSTTTVQQPAPSQITRVLYGLKFDVTQEPSLGFHTEPADGSFINGTLVLTDTADGLDNLSVTFENGTDKNITIPKNAEKIEAGDGIQQTMDLYRVKRSSKLAYEEQLRQDWDTEYYLKSEKSIYKGTVRGVQDSESQNIIEGLLMSATEIVTTVQ